MLHILGRQIYIKKLNDEVLFAIFAEFCMSFSLRPWYNFHTINGKKAYGFLFLHKNST